MPRTSTYLLPALTLFGSVAFADDATLLRDLDAIGWKTLSKDELSQLLPGATMRRLTPNGNTHIWKNDGDGSFIISSDRRDTNRGSSTTPGKWHLSDDGRYCILIEWRTVNTEEWCRYIIRAGSSYYGVRSDKTGTEKLHRLEISN